jgi:putative ABC transport system permease protein
VFLLIESLRAALGAINARRFRAFLTSLGIIVGVASIIGLVSIIQGLSGSVTQLFEGLGSNSLTVTAFTSQEKQLRGQFARLLPEDLVRVRERVTGVASITPLIFSQLSPGGTSRVGFASKSTYTRTIGTTYQYQALAQLETAKGRFLSDGDDKTRRRVAVIGEEVRRNLALPANPVDNYIEVNGEWVKVIGLMASKGDSLGFNQDDFVLLPYNTMQSMIGNTTQSNLQILLEVQDVGRMDEVRSHIRRLLRASHRLGAQEDDDFKIQNPEQLLSTFSKLVSAVTNFTIGMISISLLVGGISIMNIMLVSVNERTREIGICKAIGAKRHHILLQFVLEALMLSLLGGAVGVLLGFGIGAVASQMLGFGAAHVPLWSVALSFGFAVFIGVGFGILPAAKAAGLDPIEALSYE